MLALVLAAALAQDAPATREERVLAVLRELRARCGTWHYASA